ncbi:hypothetical protein [Enterococcus sp. HY326]|uniref:hypothetical protein n=1 Tax=Enterococcus sp. HY326 TaxID=2971265 RepID=UPI002240A6F7|nr:hypothetical protein [Enterococcus sp. HY326]
MREKEYYAVVAMEEAAEVQQALAKALHFGYQDTHPARDSQTNASEILTEFYQLTAMIEKLQDLAVLPQLSEPEITAIKQNKMAKVKHYLNYSQEQGLIEPS